MKLNRVEFYLKTQGVDPSIYGCEDAMQVADALFSHLDFLWFYIHITSQKLLVQNETAIHFNLKIEKLNLCL